MGTQTFTASDTWTAPAGVTSVDAECWAGGETGAGHPGNNPSGDKGGGGGAYAKKLNIPVTPGNNYTVTVAALVNGTNGASVPGNDSWFKTSGTVLAKGGGTFAANTGGRAADSIGDTKFSGGNGGDPGLAANGGGGGAGAHSAGDGAIGEAGGSGGDNGLGGAGNGGTGGAAPGPNNGGQGSAPGAGGGGASAGNNLTGGNGERGQVTLTWVDPVIVGPRRPQNRTAARDEHPERKW